MRRADRLFQIVQLLRRGRAVTAAQLATELEVSARTVYRDVQDLMAAGVPIQGEAGVGYALPAHFELPPLMFDGQELQAIVLGARMVQGWSDAELARAARSALRKIEDVLPPALAERIESNKLFVPDFHIGEQQHAAMTAVRAGLDQNRVLQLDYADERSQRTARAVRPLGLFYWGGTWTLAAWCELRRDFRNFRLDRIANVILTSRAFAAEAGKRLEDFFARMQQMDAGPREPVVAPATVRRRPGRAGSRAPSDPAERSAWLEFQQLGSIGPACALDLVQLGFRRIEELAGQDPNALYARLCELTGTRQDPCVEDTLRCAVAQADDPTLPAKWRKWHRWTLLRGEPAGTLPAELRDPDRSR